MSITMISPDQLPSQSCQPVITNNHQKSMLQCDSSEENETLLKKFSSHILSSLNSELSPIVFLEESIALLKAIESMLSKSYYMKSIMGEQGLVTQLMMLLHRWKDFDISVSHFDVSDSFLITLFNTMSAFVRNDNENKLSLGKEKVHDEIIIILKQAVSRLNDQESTAESVVLAKQIIVAALRLVFDLSNKVEPTNTSIRRTQRISASSKDTTKSNSQELKLPIVATVTPSIGIQASSKKTLPLPVDLLAVSKATTTRMSMSLPSSPIHPSSVERFSQSVVNSPTNKNSNTMTTTSQRYDISMTTKSQSPMNNKLQFVRSGGLIVLVRIIELVLSDISLYSDILYECSKVIHSLSLLSCLIASLNKINMIQLLHELLIKSYEFLHYCSNNQSSKMEQSSNYESIMVHIIKSLIVLIGDKRNLTHFQSIYKESVENSSAMKSDCPSIVIIKTIKEYWQRISLYYQEIIHLQDSSMKLRHRSKVLHRVSAVIPHLEEKFPPIKEDEIHNSFDTNNETLLNPMSDSLGMTKMVSPESIKLISVMEDLIHHCCWLLLLLCRLQPSNESNHSPVLVLVSKDVALIKVLNQIIRDKREQLQPSMLRMVMTSLFPSSRQSKINCIKTESNNDWRSLSIRYTADKARVILDLVNNMS